MADRYWVGGTALWDGTAGTKWAATSGGVGGASVPTTADDVFFDANSGTGTVTISSGNTGAKSINCTGFAGTIGGNVAITVAGSVTLNTTMGYTHTGIITFTNNATITTAGKNFSGIVIDALDKTVTLDGSVSMPLTRDITVTRGTFNAAGFAIACGVFASNNSNTRTIDLTNTTLTSASSTGINFSNTTNLTLITTNSQINLSGTAATLNGASLGGSLTFNNVSFTSGAAGTRNISGNNTFQNLTLTTSAVGLSQLSINANQTITGTLTCSGSDPLRRGFVRSDTIGTTRTITANAISANDCDFRDITIAGSAAGSSPTRAGDCGGNSGITFPAPKTVYRVGSITTWGGSSSWATSSGGTGSNNNIPLPQDTAVIDNNTTLTGNLGILGYNISSIDASSRTNAITFTSGNPTTLYGSYTLGSGVTVTSTSSHTFAGRGTMTFTSAGKTITFPITVDAPTGTFQLGDACTTTSGNGITLTTGTFDAVTYNVTTPTFSSSNSNTRTINMGSGLWTFTTGSGSFWNTGTTTNLTFAKGAANLLITNTTASVTRTIAGGGLSFNKLTIGGGSTASNITFITNSGTSFTEIDSTKTVAHNILLGGSITIGSWLVTGTSGNVVTVNSSAPGLQRTITLTNVTSGIDYLAVQDIGITSPNRFYVGANSTDLGNNTNVYFTAAPAPSASNSNFFLMFG